MIRASVQYRQITAGVGEDTLFPVAAVEYIVLSVDTVEFKYPNSSERQFDISYVLDVSKYEAIKALQDAGEISDQSPYDMVKPLSDAFGFTDSDYLGLAKPATDVGAATDTVSLHPVSGNVDYVGASDTSSNVWSYNRSVSDSVSVTDDISIGYLSGEELATYLNLTRIEHLSALDSIYVVFGSERSFSEVLTTYDSPAAVREPLKADASGASDTAVPSIQKPINEVISVSDAAQLSREQFPADGVSATDDLDGAISPLDDQEIATFKFRTETLGATDQFVITTGFTRSIAESINIVQNVNKLTTQTRSDTVGCSDSGVLLIQDYVARPDYFADDYVGTTTAI